eukprot:gene10284-7187_t
MPSVSSARLYVLANENLQCKLLAAFSTINIKVRFYFSRVWMYLISIFIDCFSYHMFSSSILTFIYSLIFCGVSLQNGGENGIIILTLPLLRNPTTCEKNISLNLTKFVALPFSVSDTLAPPSPLAKGKAVFLFFREGVKQGRLTPRRAAVGPALRIRARRGDGQQCAAAAGGGCFRLVACIWAPPKANPIPRQRILDFSPSLFIEIREVDAEEKRKG